jgi:hypothetical protein
MLSAGIELSIAGRNWMPSDMTKHEHIAKALKARLSKLTNRVVEIESKLRKPLSADLEEQATDLVKPPITLYSMYKVTNITATKIKPISITIKPTSF